MSSISIIFYLVFVVVSFTTAEEHHMKLPSSLTKGKTTKRQIFRETVAPGLGNYIPAGALTPQRLHLNAFDTLGIEKPEGLVSIPRENNIVPPDKDIEDTYETLTLRSLNHDRMISKHGRHKIPDQITTYLWRRPSGYGTDVLEPGVIGIFDIGNEIMKQPRQIPSTGYKFGYIPYTFKSIGYSPPDTYTNDYISLPLIFPSNMVYNPYSFLAKRHVPKYPFSKRVPPRNVIGQTKKQYKARVQDL